VKKLHQGNLEPKALKTAKIIGTMGYIARGIVVGIIGYFFMRAAIESDAQEVGGTSSAFDFLQNTGGLVLMGIIAVGVALYGVFMFIKAKYADIMA
jgi:hypothetical protein